MRECSSYRDRRVPSLYPMEEIGWVLLSKSAGRSIGFLTSAKFRELEADDADIFPATAYGGEQDERSRKNSLLTIRFLFAYTRWR